jgi:hypothetical protein
MLATILWVIGHFLFLCSADPANFVIENIREDDRVLILAPPVFFLVLASASAWVLRRFD